MKTTAKKISTLLAALAATAALLAGSLPAQADLTGPKPPSNSNGPKHTAPAPGAR